MTESVPRERSRLGRLIVTGLFWVVCLYLGGAMIGSVAVSLYGRPPKHGSSEAAWRNRQRTWCLNQLTGMKDELEMEVTHELSYVRPRRSAATESRRQTWRSEWEIAYEDAAARCTTGFDPEMGDAYQELLILYRSYNAGVSEITRSRGELAQALMRHVDALKAVPPH